MLAKRKTGRTATGEGHAVHFEERNDVLVEGAIVFELIRQVENDIRLEAFQLLPQQIEIVENRLVLRRVAKFTEGFENICLRLPFHGLQLRAEILVERGADHRVEQREDFELSFHGNMLTNPSPGLRPPSPHPLGRGQGEGRFVCFI